eukprot:TRINITY_DN70713_c0_g1_i1.p1 TRINITY_DN70713_c0_g1~~TRINITY_DN70713_c0_g1_i1.p1  ORF type:complete len:289 (-),score=41.88 TRINITY_DN70713_c0_g1_i1:166-1032(-)
MPVLDILVSTPVVILGVAGYCGVVDITTQYAEHKLLKARRKPPYGSKDSKDRQFSTTNRQPFRLNTGRVLRMTGLGVVSGIFAISFFKVVNGVLPGEPSLSLAFQKACLAAFVVGPPMFCLQVTVNEILVHGHFGTVGPKIRQDFLPTCAMNVLYLPISVIGYALFVDPAALVLFNAPLSFVFSLGLNHLLNREVETPDLETSESSSDTTTEVSKDSSAATPRKPDAPVDAPTGVKRAREWVESPSAEPPRADVHIDEEEDAGPTTCYSDAAPPGTPVTAPQNREEAP